MHNLHNYFVNKYAAYALWHSHRRRNTHHFVAFTLVALGVTVGLVGSVEDSPQLYAESLVHAPPSVRSLTNQMFSAIQAYEATDPVHKEQVFALVQPIITARNDALRNLEARRPENAVNEFLPPGLVHSFPPEIANLLQGDVARPTSTRVRTAATTRMSEAVGSGCVPHSPLAFVSPQSQTSFFPGATLTYEFLITNTDSPSCPPTTYAISMKMPGGWIGSISPLSLVVTAGSTSSVHIGSTPPATTANGLRTLTIDARGGSLAHTVRSSMTHVIYADITKPTVTVTATTKKVVVSVEATALDNVGVKKVEFYIDGSLVETDTSAPYEFKIDTKKTDALPRTITAKAYDAAGNAGLSQPLNVSL